MYSGLTRSVATPVVSPIASWWKADVKGSGLMGEVAIARCRRCRRKDRLRVLHAGIAVHAMRRGVLTGFPMHRPSPLAPTGKRKPQTDGLARTSMRITRRRKGVHVGRPKAERAHFYIGAVDIGRLGRSTLYCLDFLVVALDLEDASDLFLRFANDGFGICPQARLLHRSDSSERVVRERTGVAGCRGSSPL
jgi:hypothetical protein